VRHRQGPFLLIPRLEKSLETLCARKHTGVDEALTANSVINLSTSFNRTGKRNKSNRFVSNDIIDNFVGRMKYGEET
jgi:hypothetical protein